MTNNREKAESWLCELWRALTRSTPAFNRQPCTDPEIASLAATREAVRRARSRRTNPQEGEGQ